MALGPDPILIKLISTKHQLAKVSKHYIETCRLLLLAHTIERSIEVVRRVDWGPCDNTLT